MALVAALSRHLIRWRCLCLVGAECHVRSSMFPFGRTIFARWSSERKNSQPTKHPFPLLVSRIWSLIAKVDCWLTIRIESHRIFFIINKCRRGWKKEQVQHARENWTKRVLDSSGSYWMYRADELREVDRLENPLDTRMKNGCSSKSSDRHLLRGKVIR